MIPERYCEAWQQVAVRIGIEQVAQEQIYMFAIEDMSQQSRPHGGEWIDKQAGDVTDLPLANKPVIVMAAGPSAENHIDFIRTIKDRIILVCADSCYWPLVNHGVTPDYCVALERRGPCRFWEGCPPTQCVLVHPTSLAKDERLSFAGQRVVYDAVFCWTQDVAIRRGPERVPLPNTGVGALPHSGIVGSVTALLACWLRPSVLGLVGFDGSYYNKKCYFSHHDVISSPQRYFEYALDGSRVVTLPEWERAARWLERLRSICPFRWVDMSGSDTIGITNNRHRTHGMQQSLFRELAHI